MRRLRHGGTEVVAIILLSDTLPTYKLSAGILDAGFDERVEEAWSRVERDPGTVAKAVGKLLFPPRQTHGSSPIGRLPVAGPSFTSPWDSEVGAFSE